MVVSPGLGHLPWDACPPLLSETSTPGLLTTCGICPSRSCACPSPRGPCSHQGVLPLGQRQRREGLPRLPLPLLSVVDTSGVATRGTGWLPGSGLWGQAGAWHTRALQLPSPAPPCCGHALSGAHTRCALCIRAWAPGYLPWPSAAACAAQQAACLPACLLPGAVSTVRRGLGRPPQGLAGFPEHSGVLGGGRTGPSPGVAGGCPTPHSSLGLPHPLSPSPSLPPCPEPRGAGGGARCTAGRLFP